MNEFLIQLPWFLLVFVVLLAGYGLLELILRVRELIHVLLLLRRAGRESSGETGMPARLSQMDRAANEFLEDKIREVWRSFSAVKWLDVHAIRDESFALVQGIARVYYPSSPRPELEVTVLELLKLNERISRELTALLAPFTILHQVSISTITDAKSMFEKTQKVMELKGVRTGGRMASRVWKTVNALNPKYWLNRLVFKGASELAGRRVLTSFYRIVGTEAIKIYSSSSAVRMDPSLLFDKELDTESAEADEEDNESASVLPDGEEAEESMSTLKDESGDESTIRFSGEVEILQEDVATKTSGGKRIYASLTKTLSSFLDGSLKLWDKAVSPQKVLASFKKSGLDIHNLKEIRDLDIAEVDVVAHRYIRKGEWLCAAEGVATGMGGIVLLASDAVALLALQLRIVQQIGYCYGFDMSKPEEKLFTAKLLVEAYQHPSKNERQALLKEMRAVAGLVKGDTPLGKLQQRLFVQGLSKIAEKIGIRLGGRKVAQFLPLVGGAVGGIVNKKITRDIASVAQEVYRDRLMQISGKE